MRIGIVSDVFYPYLMGGAERRYWEVARRLAREHEVHAFTMRWYGAPREEVVEGVRIHHLNVPRGLYANGRRSTWEALRFTAALLPPCLRDWGFDVIDANQFPFLPLFPSRLMAFRNCCPLVATWNEVWGEYWYEYMGGRLYGAIGRGIERLSSRLPDRIIAISTKTKEGLTGGLSIPPGRVSVVPTGVDLELISSIEVEKEGGKIVYAGRLAPHKNLDTLIEAMPRVLEEVPGTKLTIVGDGPMKEGLVSLAEGLRLKGSVEWKGVLDYTSALREIKSATLLVLPSTREGSGMVMLEAMAAGTAVLAVRAEGSAAMEVLEGGRGVLCEISDLGKQIALLLEDEGLRGRLVEEGRRYARERDYGKMVDEVWKVYKEAIADGRP